MQALFPVRSTGKWGYLNETIDADIAVLTEAKPDLPSSYQQVYQEGGIGPRRRWGTIVATRSPYTLVETRYVSDAFGTDDLYLTHPGTVVVCDVLRDGERLLTVVGIYALTVDDEGVKVGHGWFSATNILVDLLPLFDTRDDKGIIVGGDLNLWPNDVDEFLPKYRLVDLVEFTAEERQTTPECVCESSKPCRHIWTHNNSFAGNFQQIDYLFATEDLARRMVSLTGGPDAFPDIWEWSDHAPLVAEFELDMD